jgi:hypothetical protein
MNIEIFYDKVGASVIPMQVKLFNAQEVFYQDHISIIDNAGSVKFYCDYPSNIECFLEFTTDAKEVVYDTLTFTAFKFDDYWHLTTECVTAQKIENGVCSTESNYDCLFYVGSLRYKIFRPVFKWATS